MLDHEKLDVYRCSIEFLRIGSKVPAVLPQRITPALVRMLRRYHPLWMSLHFIHPDELTPEVERACSRLADAGIPLGSQTPLLAGINDSVEVCRRLFHGLLRYRVKPYYLYQADLVVGTSHFHTTMSKGLEIIAGLPGAVQRSVETIAGLPGAELCGGPSRPSHAKPNIPKASR